MRLQTEIAIVTGAGQGIGRAIARALAAEGAAVVVGDVVEERAEAAVAELRAAGTRALAVTADVGDRAQAEGLVRRAEAEFGRVDILVNNAGISPKSLPGPRRASIWEMDPAEWERVVQVNFTGSFYMARAVAPGMRDRHHGFIINMSSQAARNYIDLVACHYTATKAGVSGLTKALAGDLAPYGVRVNAIAPGRIRTELATSVPEEVNRKFLETVPMGCWGEPEDIAQAVLFLVTEPSRYITGLTLDVNGGAWMP